MLQLSCEAAAAVTLHKFDAARLLHNSLVALFCPCSFFARLSCHATDHLFAEQICHPQLATFFTSATQPNPRQNLEIAKLEKIYCFTAEGGGPAKWVAKSHQCFIFQIAEVRPPHLPKNLDAPDVLIAPSILCSALVIPPSLTAFHNDWFQHWRISHCILKSKKWCKSNKTIKIQINRHRNKIEIQIWKKLQWKIWEQILQRRDQCTALTEWYKYTFKYKYKYRYKYNFKYKYNYKSDTITNTDKNAISDTNTKKDR